MDAPLAVIDIGSNSARVVVLQLNRERQLEILADARASLQLSRQLDGKNRLENGAVAGAIAAVRDFQAVASAAGARRTVAVATAAIRSASNRDQVISRIEAATGLTVKVIEGDTEARYAFMGAVHGLPVENGYLMDVGGGSMELAYFVARRPLRWWTLPLGSLQATDRFLRSDPPRASEISDLRDHIAVTLRNAGVPEAREDESLVGTGGTVRNLAKVHLRSAGHPIARVDGYTLQRRDVREVTTRLLTRTLAQRRSTPGLSADRADSISGGAVIITAALDLMGARTLIVSGHGLREGIALAELGLPMPETAEVRRASVRSLASHFTTWSADRAEGRLSLARTIVAAADPAMSEEMRELLDHAAVLLDIGQNVNYYDRWAHAASMVAAADLRGFSHREVAVIATTLAVLAKGRNSLPRYARLLTRDDISSIDRAAMVLEVAHELELRLEPSRLASVRAVERRGRVVITAPLASPWPPVELVRRFRRRFGRSLALRVAASPRKPAARQQQTSIVKQL